MDVAQIDHDLNALQALAQQFIQHRDDLSEAQIETLAGILQSLAPFYQDAALVEDNRRLKDLIRLAPASMYQVDFRTKRFTLVNDKLCELSGYSREELLGMSPFDILDDSGKALFQWRINQWLAGNHESRIDE